MQQRSKRFAALACGVTLVTIPLAAQQPKSPKERDAIIAVQNAQTPDDKIKAIENVLTHFADTQFKNVLLQMAVTAEEQKGDYAQVVFYAQRLLQSDPKNAYALVTLAIQTANHTREFDLDKDQKLAQADKWAKEGIEDAKVAPKPRPDYPDDQWEAARKDFQAQGYEALGMSAELQKKYDDAAADFKQSLALGSMPDAATYLRLGQAYEDAGKLDDAADAYNKAGSLPNVSPQVKSIADSKKQEIAKRKTGGPASPQH